MGAERKQVLHGVSATFRSGRLTAVMGPSGSGKTTLLSAVLGHGSLELDGQLLLNGEPVGAADRPQLRKLVGFVPQECIMLGTLTVEQILTHSARMRLPSAYSAEVGLVRQSSGPHFTRCRRSLRVSTK